MFNFFLVFEWRELEADLAFAEFPECWFWFLGFGAVLFEETSESEAVLCWTGTTLGLSVVRRSWPFCACFSECHQTHQEHSISSLAESKLQIEHFVWLLINGDVCLIKCHSCWFVTANLLARAWCGLPGAWTPTQEANETPFGQILVSLLQHFLNGKHTPVVLIWFGLCLIVLKLRGCAHLTFWSLSWRLVLGVTGSVRCIGSLWGLMAVTKQFPFEAGVFRARGSVADGKSSRLIDFPRRLHRASGAGKEDKINKRKTVSVFGI